MVREGVVVEATGKKMDVGGSGEESGGGLLGTVGEGGAVGGNEGSAGVAGSVGDTSGGGEDGVPGEIGTLVGGSAGTLGVGKREVREEMPTKIELERIASPMEEIGSTLPSELTATDCVLLECCADVLGCNDGGGLTCDDDCAEMDAKSAALVLETGGMIVDRVVGAPLLLEDIAGAATLLDDGIDANNRLEVGKGTSEVALLEIGTGTTRLLIEVREDAEETRGLKNVDAGAARLLDVGMGITKLSEVVCDTVLLRCDCCAATLLDGDGGTRLLRCDCCAAILLDGDSGTRLLRELGAGGTSLLGSATGMSDADMDAPMLLDADTSTASLLDVTSEITRRLLLLEPAAAMELETEGAASMELLKLDEAAMTLMLLAMTKSWLVELGDLVPDVLTRAVSTADEAG
jgi:hypothetical protein